MEKFKLEIGNSFDAACEDDNRYVTMKYRFKPSSVQGQDCVAALSSSGEVELKYTLEPQNAYEEHREAVSGDVVRLRGTSSMKEEEGFTECILFINRPVDGSSSSSSSENSRCVARLERVQTRVTGLNHERGENFAYAPSEARQMQSRSRVAGKPKAPGSGKRTAEGSVGDGVETASSKRQCTKGGKEVRKQEKLAAQLEAVLASSTDAGVVQQRRRAAEAALKARQTEAQAQAQAQSELLPVTFAVPTEQSDLEPHS